MYQPCVDDTCLKPRCRILQVSRMEFFFPAFPAPLADPPISCQHAARCALGVTLTVIYLSNFLAHFLSALPDDIKQALRLIRQRTRAPRVGALRAQNPGLPESEAITVEHTVRARNVRKMLVNDMAAWDKTG